MLDGFKDVNFSSTYDGMYSVKIHTMKNITELLPEIDQIFQDDLNMKLSYESYWRHKFVTTAGKK